MSALPIFPPKGQSAGLQPNQIPPIALTTPILRVNKHAHQSIKSALVLNDSCPSVIVADRPVATPSSQWPIFSASLMMLLTTRTPPPPASSTSFQTSRSVCLPSCPLFGAFRSSHSPLLRCQQPPELALHRHAQIHRRVAKIRQ